ncbi:MAG TPA: hypothetical protein VM802_17325 [Chitinophaga sp.]|uniref:hypothetical protein n=1 Tax=Chitinophaga sp. TaxID=1869181 RepID=UPI002D1A96D3|nr:hypothetical protein [Chitinophaga sp.]HVI46643.1 hypothetical protein [Chitinophaga sp.]
MAFFSFKKPLADSPPRYLVPAAPTCIYAVTTTFAGAAPQELKYNVEVQRFSNPKDPTGVYLQVTRTDIMINGSRADDSIAGDLASQCGNVIYPLQVKLADGGRIAMIVNHSDILQRWNEQQIKLGRYFTGEIAGEYIAGTDATLQDAERLLQVLRQDLFLSAYCYLLFAGYRKESAVQYTVIPFKNPVRYTVTQERTPFGMEPDSTQQKGVLETGSHKDYSHAVFEVKSVLNKARNYIRQLDGSWEVREGERLHRVMLSIICIDDNTNTEQ